MPEDDIVYRLLKRAEIRRQIPSRKSVQEGKPDRLSDLLEEAAKAIEGWRDAGEEMTKRIEQLEKNLHKLQALL